MTQIDVQPLQDGSAKATATFTDEDTPPNAVTPLTANWTLTDGLGNAINSRRHVTLAPAASISWLISAADLAISDNGTERILIVDWTYNSTLGSNIPGRAQAQFSIEPVVIVPAA